MKKIKKHHFLSINMDICILIFNDKSERHSDFIKIEKKINVII